MSNDDDRRSAPGGRTAVSLVAVLTCALASEALAGLSPAKSTGTEQDLSARVASIAALVRQADPALVHSLPPEMKTAQWRNY
jgi:hypothetical protein